MSEATLNELQSLYDRGLLVSSDHIRVSRHTDGRFSLNFTTRVLDALGVEVPFAADDFEDYAAGAISSLDKGQSGTTVKWSATGRFV